MPATLDIRDLSDRLILRVHESANLSRTILRFLVTALVAALFLYFGHASRFVQVVFGAFALLALAREASDRLRGTDVTLEVNHLDLISRGHAPYGYSPSSIPRASIYHLAFRKDKGDGDDNPSPMGLYATQRGILSNPATCLLPHIDEAQTRQAIQTILRRFPDTGSLAPPAKPDLITLNLNR